MNFGKFIKEKIVFIIFQLCIVLFFAFVLNSVQIHISIIIYICVCVMLLTLGVLIYEYVRRKIYYKKVYDLLDQLDKKYFLSTVLEEGDFQESEILFDILGQISKSMNDEIAKHKIINNEYRDYIETWIHEIKLPISCISLICENDKNDTTKSIQNELSRIDSYVEQALFYARSTNLEKDYSIRQVNLDRLVKDTIKKYSKQLISLKAHLDFNNLEKEVYCDTKWLVFILGQIISNSIKYRKKELTLNFSAVENDDNIILKIKDNGIGISQSDIGRVFDKGFTGESGRIYGKSTGIGLYLCKKLCDKMNLQIDIKSEQGQWTEVSIIFPKDSRILLQN